MTWAPRRRCPALPRARSDAARMLVQANAGPKHKSQRLTGFINFILSFFQFTYTHIIYIYYYSYIYLYHIIALFMRDLWFIGEMCKSHDWLQHLISRAPQWLLLAKAHLGAAKSISRDPNWNLAAAMTSLSRRNRETIGLPVSKSCAAFIWATWATPLLPPFSEHVFLHLICFNERKRVQESSDATSTAPRDLPQPGLESAKQQHLGLKDWLENSSSSIPLHPRNGSVCVVPGLLSTWDRKDCLSWFRPLFCYLGLFAPAFRRSRPLIMASSS